MTDLLRILIAPLVWLAAFISVYALHGLLCALQMHGMVLGIPLERLSLVTAYGLAILMQIVLLLAVYRGWPLAPSSEFVRFVSRVTGWTGLMATIWSLLPVMMTTSC